MQTIFFWTLIARNISRYFDRNCALPPAGPALQTVESLMAGDTIASNMDTGQNTDEIPLDHVGQQESVQQHGLLAATPAEDLLLSPQQEEHILQVLQLFDTDDSGILDESELHSAMFALGYLSDNRDNFSAFKDSIELRQRVGIGAGVTLDEFRNIMRGSLLGRGAMDEMRMTFEAIICVPSNVPGNQQASKIRRAQDYVCGSGYQLGNQILMEGAVHESALASGPDERISNPTLDHSNRLSSSVPCSNDLFPSVEQKFQASRLVRRTRGGSHGARITFDNLRLACQRFDVKLTDEELKSIISETDRDHSGDVDWDEYINILKNSCWF